MGNKCCVSDQTDNTAFKKIVPYVGEPNLYQPIPQNVQLTTPPKLVQRAGMESQNKSLSLKEPALIRKEQDTSRMSFNVLQSSRPKYEQMSFRRHQIIRQSSKNISRLSQLKHFLQLRQRLSSEQRQISEISFTQSDPAESLNRTCPFDYIQQFQRCRQLLEDPELYDTHLQLLAQTQNIKGHVYPVWNKQFQLKQAVTKKDILMSLKEQARTFDYRDIKADGNYALAISSITQYCQQHKVGIIKQNIWPRTASLQYHIKLYINGTFRKTTLVNSFLKGHQFAVSTLSPSQAWMQILGEALRNSFFDRPDQSPSSILYRLCGWIPQTIIFSEVPKKNLWSKLYQNHSEGNLLISFGVQSAQKSEKLNYILILRLISFKKEQKFVKLRFFGNYPPPFKTLNLSKMSKEYLNLFQADPKEEEYTSGTYWVQWRSLTDITKVIELSWPTHIYPYRMNFHCKVDFKDSLFYNNRLSIKYFPQFLIKIRPHEDDFQVRVFGEGHTVHNNVPKFSMRLFHFNNERIAYPHQSLRSIPFQEGTLGDVFIFEQSERTDYYVLAICPETHPMPSNLEQVYSLFMGSFMDIEVYELPFRKITHYSELLGCFDQTNIGQNLYSPEFNKSDQYRLSVHPPSSFISAQIQGPQNGSIMLILIRDQFSTGNFQQIPYDYLINQHKSKGFYFQSISSLETKVQPGDYILIVSILNREYGQYKLRLMVGNQKLASKFRSDNLPPVLLQKVIKKEYPFNQLYTNNWNQHSLLKNFILKGRGAKEVLSQQELQNMIIVKAHNEQCVLKLCLRSKDYQNLYHEFYDEDISEKTIELQPPNMGLVIYKIYFKEGVIVTQFLMETPFTNSSFGIFTPQLSVQDRNHIFGIGILCLSSEENEGSYQLSVQSDQKVVISLLEEVLAKLQEEKQKTLPNSMRRLKQKRKSLESDKT